MATTCQLIFSIDCLNILLPSSLSLILRASVLA